MHILNNSVYCTSLEPSHLVWPYVKPYSLCDSGFCFFISCLFLISLSLVVTVISVPVFVIPTCWTAYCALITFTLSLALCVGSSPLLSDHLCQFLGIFPLVSLMWWILFCSCLVPVHVSWVSSQCCFLTVSFGLWMTSAKMTPAWRGMIQFCHMAIHYHLGTMEEVGPAAGTDCVALSIAALTSTTSDPFTPSLLSSC